MTEQSRDDSSTISLGNEREVLDLVANSIMGLWDVVNDLTRLRPTQREHYRVTIFGSARIPEDHWVYAARARRCRRAYPARMRYCDGRRSRLDGRCE